MRHMFLALVLTLLAGVAAAQDCVILLHGIARSPASMDSLKTALEKEGYTAESFAYPDTDKNLADIVTALQSPLAAYAAQCKGQVHFITHSMGGLVARAYLNTNRPANLGRVVMLAPPNHGSEVADFLKNNALYNSFFGPAGQQLTTVQDVSFTTLLGTPTYPLGIIAGTRTVNPITSWLLLPGPNDGAVTVSSTKVTGMTDFISLPTTHTFMVNNTTVQKQTIQFLKTGHFQH